MQPNFSNRNTSSHLIKSSETARKKARRRLIGSVFMLLVALIILLNVTAKTKPIPVNPKVIEIKRNTSNAATMTHKAAASAATVSNASAPIRSNQNASGIVAVNSSGATSQVVASQSTNASSAIAKPITANQVNATESGSQTESSATPLKLDIYPKVVTETAKSTLSPEDILNGKTITTPTNKYFIQLIADKDKQNLIQIKTELEKKGINSFIQPIKTNNGIIYRLRVGPFKNKTQADKRLGEIQKAI